MVNLEVPFKRCFFDIYNTIEEIKEPHSDMTSRRECFFCFCIVLNDNIEQLEHTNCDHVHSKEIILCREIRCFSFVLILEKDNVKRSRLDF